MENLPTNEKLMTVDELSEIFSVHKTTILKYINKAFPDKIKSGIKTFLNEAEVTKIKLELQQNQHLSQSSTLPKTELEENFIILQAQNLLSQRIKKLQEEIELKSTIIEEQRPLVEFSKKVETSVNSISVAEFANLLTKDGFKIGQNNLFKWFYENKYLIKSDRPYQKTLDNGWVEMKKIAYEDNSENERTTQKTMITGKGQLYFTNILKKTKAVELGQKSF